MKSNKKCILFVFPTEHIKKTDKETIYCITNEWIGATGLGQSNH